jgi:ribonuclease-3
MEEEKPIENLEHYIMNDKNIYITEKFIKRIFDKFGLKIKINNLSIYQNAMVHKSYLKRDMNYSPKLDSKTDKLIKENNILPQVIKDPFPLQDRSYDVLEFSGDSIIRCILTIYLTSRYPDENEGFLTRLRSRIEDYVTLPKLATSIGLNKYIIIGRYLEVLGYRKYGDKILEDAFEAFFGAIIKDTGSFDLCQSLLIKLIEAELDFSDLISTENNFKALLLKHYHKMKWNDPEYGVIPQKAGTKNHYCIYVKGFVQDGDNYIWTNVATGQGSTKKIGQQQAAKAALIYYKIISDDYENDENEEIIDVADLEYD